MLKFQNLIVSGTFLPLSCEPNFISPETLITVFASGEFSTLKIYSLVGFQISFFKEKNSTINLLKETITKKNFSSFFNLNSV